MLGEPSHLRHVPNARTIRLVSRDRTSVDENLAGRGTREAENELDERRLPRPVRSNDPRHSTACNPEIDAAKDVEAAESLRQADHLDHGAGHRILRMAGVASTTVSGVSVGNTRSATSSSSTRAPRMRMRAGGWCSTISEKSRTGRCGTSPMPSRFRSYPR